MPSLKDRLLAVYRNSEKKSYKDFAEAIGVSKSTVDYWMSRGGSPSAANLKEICKVYNVSEEWLVYGLNVVKDDGTKYEIMQNCEKYRKEIEFLKNQLREKTEYIELLKKQINP